MQTIFGEKETSRPSGSEAGLHFDEEESADKKSEELNSPKSPESCLSIKKLTSGNFKTFSLHFDNSDVNGNDSNIFSLSVSKNKEISTSKSASGTFWQRKVSNETVELDNTSSLSDVSGCKSKNRLKQRLEKRSKSDDSLGRPSDNLLLRKTEEVSDFNFKKFNEMNVIKENSFQCAVERLVLGNEKRARRSDLCERDNEMNLFSEIDLTASQSGDCKKLSKKLLRWAPFRYRRRVKKRPIESQGEKKNNGFWSKKPYFNKARFVNFFMEKDRNTSKRSEFIELNVTEKGDPKPNKLIEKFVKPKVPLEEDLETKLYFKDLLFYIIYLVLLTTIAMNMVSVNMYYFTNITAKLFMDSDNTLSPNRSEYSDSGSNESDSKYNHKMSLSRSQTFDDFWNFAETTMIDLFYWNFYYSKMNSVAHTEKDDRKMFFENQMLGVPRLRQVRVRNDSCLVHSNMKRFFNSCYNYYSPFTEETRPIKEGMETSPTATAWVYTKAENLYTSHYWGEISVYGGGGYYLDLNTNKEKTKELIKELKENHWLSRATRAVFIDFNLYNANVNLFCLCKIVLEFPPVGGIIPKADFQTLKLIRYLTALDFFILGCEFLLILYVLYFTWKLVRKGLQQKSAFFVFFWNYLDLITLLLLWTYIILSIIRYISVDKLIHTLDKRFYEYTEFSFIREVQIHFNNVMAVLLFASWIKLFTFLTFNAIMLEFRKTLQKSFIGILGFFPMFLTLYLAFAFLANLLFGNEVKDYSTVWFSFLSLLQTFLGEFQYSEIQESHRVLGPIFYVAFVFFLFFVLLNVFIAIINDAYAKVKSEVILIRPKIGEYAKTGILNLMTCCHLRKKLKKKTSVGKKLIFTEIRKALENAGFSADEIKIFLSKYNINVHNILDKSTRRRVMQDLELKQIDFEENARQSQINFLRRRIDNLSSRIQNMDINLQPVIDKVDVLLDRFSSKKYS